MAGRSNILIAAIAGLALGIGIGMLIAPEKGSKTRKKLKDKFLEIADKLEDGFPASFEELKEILSSENTDEEAEASGREATPAA